MEKIPHSRRFLQRRKSLLMLPLLVSFMLILLFRIFGGGGAVSDKTGKQDTSKGLDTTLPDAHFKKESPEDKLSVYNKAQQDSLKARATAKSDTSFHPAAGTSPKDTSVPLKNSVSPKNAEPNDQRVLDRLARLQQVMHRSSMETEQLPPRGYSRDPYNPDSGPMQKMLETIHSATPVDPQIVELNKMLDKLMVLQNPQRNPDSAVADAGNRKPPAFVVTVRVDSSGNDSGGFYGLSDDPNTVEPSPRAIEAVIEGDQTLVSGATVKLRLLSEVFVKGIRVPRDEFLYGTAQLSNERLRITIHSLRSDNNILPVSLEAYDLDGMAGIYIPGSINRDAGKQSADQAIGSVGITNLDPTIGGQAANAGIQAARTLLSRKVRLIQVRVKAGYKVLLVNTNKSQN